MRKLFLPFLPTELQLNARRYNSMCLVLPGNGSTQWEFNGVLKTKHEQMKTGSIGMVNDTSVGRYSVMLLSRFLRDVKITTLETTIEETSYTYNFTSYKTK